jgi:hypothetical protein
MTVTTDVLFFATDPTHGRETDGIFNISHVKRIKRARDE